MRYAYCNTVYCLVFLFYWQRHPNALVIFSLKYIADFLKERNPWWLTYKFIWKVIFIPYLKMKYIFCAFVLSVNPRCDPVPETSHSTSEQTKLILDANFSLWKILASILYCDFIKPGNCGMRLKLDENICLERKVNFLPKGAELQFCKKKTFLNTQHPSQLTMNEGFARELSI